MAFVPEQRFPDLTQLITSLNNSQISIKNPALYQTIKGLIEKVQQIKGLAQEDIDNINQTLTDLSNLVNNISITGAIPLPIMASPLVVESPFEIEPFFAIPGLPGRDGLDGRSFPWITDFEEPVEPPPLIPQCCALEASEITFTTTGNIDDLDFGNARLIRMNNASLATIRGLKAGLAGQKVTIVSVGAGDVHFTHQASSAAANQLRNFITVGPTPLLNGKGTANFEYDVTTAKWRLISSEQGGHIAIAYTAGDWTGSGTITWTVDDADETMSFYIRGRKLILNVLLNTTTISGAGTELRFTLPNGWTINRDSINANLRLNDGAAWQAGYTYCGSGATFVRFFVDMTGSTNWPAVADAAYLQATIEMELQ